MANRYWVGGAGTWTSTNTANWSATSGGAGGASVPVAGDAVSFDSNSGTGTVTTNYNVTLDNLSITSANITLSLGGTLTASTTLSIQLGTFTTNNFAVSCLSIGNASSSGARTLNLGSSTITATGQTPFQFSSGTTTLNAGTSVFDFNTSGFTSGATIQSSGLTFYRVRLRGVASTNVGGWSISGQNTFFSLEHESLSTATSNVYFFDNQTFISRIPSRSSSSYTLILSSTGGPFQFSSGAAAGFVFYTDALVSNITASAANTFYAASLNGTTTNWTAGTPPNRYWVGGTGIWDATVGTKWSYNDGGTGGAPVPGSTNDVIFNAASGAVTVTVGSSFSIKSLTCTGFTGFLSFSGVSLTVGGNLTLSAGMTFNPPTTTTFTGTGTFTPAGKTMDAVTINAPSSTVTLGGALSAAAFSGTGGLTLTAGTFTTNGYSITATNFTISGSSTRALNLGNSTITLVGNGTAWNVANSTGFTLNAGTSTIICSSASSVVGFNLGVAGTYNNFSFTGASSSTVTLTSSGASIAGTLTLTAPASTGIKGISFPNNLTVGTMVASGASDVRRLYFASNPRGTARTLTVTTWSTISDIDFEDISLNSSRSGTRLGNRGGNTNITFPAAKTVYWNLGGSNNWSATGWATSSGGTPASGNFPLAQDTAIIDNSSGGSSIVVDNANWALPTVNSSSRTTSFGLNVGSTTCYGSWINGSGITLSGASITFSGRSSYTYTENGKSVNNVYCQVISGTLTLGSAASTATLFYLLNGTLNLAGYSLTCGTFNTSNTSDTRNITFNGGTISVGTFSASATGFTTTAGTGTGVINFTGATGTFNSDGATYNCTVNCACTTRLTLSGSPTITTLANSVQPTNLRFTSGTTTTVTNFNVSGTAGNLVTIDATTTSAATLSKASGTVNANYLNISYSTATGGATWNALNSTDGGNNTGWVFSSVGGGNFLAFFM